jgi:hypothetical protein
MSNKIRKLIKSMPIILSSLFPPCAIRALTPFLTPLPIEHRGPCLIGPFSMYYTPCRDHVSTDGKLTLRKILDLARPSTGMVKVTLFAEDG